jgi:hypothetical protein
MTPLRRLLALSALLGVVGVLAGCGGGGLAAESLTVDQLSQAATASTQAPSGRFAFSFDMTFPGTSMPLEFSGEGAYDTEAERTALTFDLSSLAGLLGGLLGGMGGTNDKNPFDFGDAGAWKIDAVQDGKVVYLRFPAIASQLPEGKTWVKVDPESTGKTAGFDLSELRELSGTDPRSLLDLLKAVSGEIETVGTDELRGVETTHYRATIDLSKYEELVPPAERKELGSMAEDLVEQSGLAEMPFDIWLDEDGHVRKVEATVAAAPEGTSEEVEASLTFELYDYGEDVDISPPPAEDVADESALTG